ncbi:MAG: methyltransferase domain-containing protein [Chitinispirillaceae bacterium]|jgi:SAM-dependent methyltransferase
MRLSLIASPLRYLYYKALLILYHGDRVLCPVCNTSLRRFRNVNRERSTPLGNICPKCGSFERHRLLWLFLRDRTDLFSSSSVRTLLHVAPEPCYRKRFETLRNLDYKVSDLQSKNTVERIDLTDIPLNDNSIDIIVCNGVLEHIPDDRKAMHELCRVLKPGGWAIINVPVDYAREQTYENAEITTGKQRKIHFGQSDHVRIYGRDYIQRLAGAGFNAREIDYVRELGWESAQRYALLTDEMIYFCTKQY